ncbi:hypothetical protein AVEN_230201-1 [Araneus ventricosus]|uniref:Uncharacterized protein n=1 Tax=Araneus ventricosus TaxID=182803 RepID=A0A4Y2VDN1_ARAVE|nr:hypothetical protein AVEN_230201-1 [Araneus ventricosus]
MRVSIKFGPQRRRPPRSPTGEGNYRLWVFPASASTLALAGAYTLRATLRNVDHPYRQAPGVDHFRLIPLSRPAKWLGYQPIDTPGITMHHPSNGSPRTANTWG